VRLADCKATAESDLAFWRATPHLIECVRSGIAAAESKLALIYLKEGDTVCASGGCNDKVGADSGLPAGLTKSIAIEEGMRLMRVAANKGDAIALNEMGYMTLEGLRGIERNHAQARAFLERGTAAGDSIAPYNLSRIYFGGYGVPRSESVGENYLRLSAQRGYHDALCSLAEFEKRRGGQGRANDPADCTSNEVMDEVEFLKDAK
jgi:TPR repeat protein